MLRCLLILSAMTAIALPAVAQDADRYTLRRDLADHYASILPADIQFEKNIVPTEVVVFSPNDLAPICRDPDDLYDMNEAMRSLKDGTIGLDEANAISEQRRCTVIAPDSWGYAVRAYANTPLLVDFIYHPEISAGAMAAEDTMYWVDPIYLRDRETNALVYDLAHSAFGR